VTSDGAAWALVNASPDVRVQLGACEALHPRGPRDSPVAAVLLTSGELDHTAGLLSLRESQPLAVYATLAVIEGFTRGNALCGALGAVAWRPLVLGTPADVHDAAGRTIGLIVEARAVPGKVPRHLESSRATSPEDVVALRIRDRRSGTLLAYCPGAGAIDDGVLSALDGADWVCFDGTFWSSDELARAGAGTRRAEEMAHAPLDGRDGGLARLAGLSAARRLLIHLNNTNPLVRDDAPERAEAARAGWEVAHDGMELAS
jgi:pyrroloquinoline quinone biosynthesis protein B